MLSAIAVRKAAQAAKQQQQQSESHHDDKRERSTTPLSTHELEQSPANLVTSDSEVDTPRKRKANGQGAQRSIRQKRMKRSMNADIGRTRYFEAEQPIEGFDDEDDGVVSGFIPEDPGPSRGYSPSRPVLDSSEDDEGGSGQETHPEPRRKQLETNHGASRRVYVPKVDTNCFRLTSDDLKKLDITKLADNVSGTLVLLPPGHSLSFVGTSCITLLQGAITVLGTLLRPSLRSHRVFSPRSSPLASIEALENPSIGEEADYTSGSIRQNLPHRILAATNASDSVVIICPLVSGVEGLGNVCRTFDGVFDVVADIRKTEAEDAIGVKGFHPVRTDGEYTSSHSVNELG